MSTSEFNTWHVALGTIEEHFLICVSQFDCDIIGGCLAIWLLLPQVSWSTRCFQLGLVVWGSFHFLNS